MIDFDLKKVKAAAMILRSIQHPIRKSLLALIDETVGISVKEIKAILQLQQSVASVHLGILRQSGILRTQRVGKSIHYYIDDNIKAISSLVNQLAIYFK